MNYAAAESTHTVTTPLVMPGSSFSSSLSKIRNLIVLAALSGIASVADAKTDTLINLVAGTQIGCTFTSGVNTVFNCELTAVGTNGRVAFVKPTEEYDKVVYYAQVGGGTIPFVPEFLKLGTSDGSDIGPILMDGMEFPILSAPFGSFFDLFTEIELLAFIADGNAAPGTFTLGDTLTFSFGVNTDGFDGLLVSGYSGTAVVSGFNVVSVPEPATLALLGLGLAGLGVMRRRRIA